MLGEMTGSLESVISSLSEIFLLSDVMNLLEYLKKNPFVLAPMAGITDYSFRSFMRDMGCGIVVTELV